ncbi:hypothetical protein BG015_004573, partial [Linnemannia schmuckeri]
LQQVTMANAQRNRLSLVSSRHLQGQREMHDPNGGTTTTTAANGYVASAGESIFPNIPQTRSYSTESAQRGKYQAAQRLASQKHRVQQLDQGQSSKTIITSTTITIATRGGTARAANAREPSSPNISQAGSYVERVISAMMLNLGNKFLEHHIVIDSSNNIQKFCQPPPSRHHPCPTRLRGKQKHFRRCMYRANRLCNIGFTKTSYMSNFNTLRSCAIHTKHI